MKLQLLEEELVALVGRSVDLVAKDALHWAMRDQVLAEARLLYVAM